MDLASTVLIAEDEPKLAHLLIDYLSQAGYATRWAATGTQALEMFREGPVDIILLDLMLPGVDGLQVCREIRRSSELPIIMITARVDEVDRLLGLELGADDYICKPFSPREVVARVKVILRRVGRAREAPANFDAPIKLDANRMRATFDDQPLNLTQSEFALLSTLNAHPGVIYSRSKLLDALGDDFRDVSDRAVDSHIKNLRKKLAQVRPEQTVVHSIYGVGYKLEL